MNPSFGWVVAQTSLSPAKTILGIYFGSVSQCMQHVASFYSCLCLTIKLRETDFLIKRETIYLSVARMLYKCVLDAVILIYQQNLMNPSFH